jgi:phage-related protein
MSVVIATGVVEVQVNMHGSDAERAANQAGRNAGDAFVRGMDGRLRDARGRFVSESRLIGNGFTQTAAQTNRFTVSVNAATNSMDRSGRSMSRVAKWLSIITSSAGGGIPVIASLVGALQNLAPASAGAATGMFALTQSIAAIKIGTSGIGDAMKAAFEPVKSSAGAAASAARQHASAMEAVQDATESAARASADAARRVKDAEDNLRDAQEEAIQVQKELTQARKDARRELEDMNLSLEGAELDLRDAKLGVADAEESLRKVQAKGNKATQLEMDEALLSLDQAKQRLKEQQVEIQRLRTDTSEANKAGIEGTQSMTNWRERMSNATNNVASQEKALADARREQAQTAADGQEAIADAMKALREQTVSTTPTVNKFAEAMAKLSPNARAFVNQLISMKPAWDNLKMGVQDTLLRGFAAQLQTTSTTFLPVLKKGLMDTAGVFNQMGLGVMQTASKLGENGVLGQAMAGANKGLSNLKNVPGQFLESLTTLAAAGTPVFDKFTQKISTKMSEWTTKLSGGLESGALEDSIETALDIAGDLFDVLGNIFEILGNVGEQFQDAGGGFFTVLKDITDAMVKFTATDSFQDMMASLASVFVTLGSVVSDILGAALIALSPIIQALAPPLNEIMRVLGDALTPIIEALGPVLAVVGEAIGSLALAFAPLLPVISKLVVALLPPLMPIFQFLSDTFKKFTPLIEMVGKMIEGLLLPVFEQLGPILAPVIELFSVITDILFPILSDLLKALMPSIEAIGKAFGELLAAVAPLLGILGELIGKILVGIAPVLTPIIALIGKLVSIVAERLASAITNVLVPAIKLVTALIKGDWSGAWDALVETMLGVWEYTKGMFSAIKNIVKAGIDAVIGIFAYLYDVLIGHSIIPDLVEGIIGLFKWLGKKAAEAFQNLWDWVVRKVRGMKDSVVGLARSLRDGLVNWVTSARDRASSVMTSLKDAVVNKARSLRDNVVGAFNTMKEKTIEAFRRAKDGIGTVWDKLKKISGTPVNFVIGTVYNNGIRKFWNAIADKIGLGSLPEIKPLKFQKGGTVDLRNGAHLPGYSRTDDTLAMVRSGEGVLVPEAVRALGGASFINRANRLKGGAGRLVGQHGIPGFAKGGIIGAVGDFISKGKDFFKEGFVEALSMVTSPIVSAMKNQFGSKPMLGLPTLIVRGIVDRIKGFLGPMSNKLEGGDGGKVVSVARSQTGYYGRPNKFTQAPGMWTDEWCGMFVDWVFKKANAYKALSPVSHTPAVRSYTSLQKVGRGSMRPGDLALYRGDAGHINIVTDPKNRETVGGNESNNRVKKSLGYVNSASSIRRPKFARGGLVDRRALRLSGGWENLRDIRWQDRKESPHVSTTDQARRNLFAPPPWVSRDMGGILPDGMMAYNTSGTAEVVTTIEQLKALVASGKGATYIFNEGAIQLDASKVKSIQDVVQMIESLRVTSRQFGARL